MIYRRGGLNVNGSRVTTPEGCTTIFVTGCKGRRWEVFIPNTRKQMECHLWPIERSAAV